MFRIWMTSLYFVVLIWSSTTQNICPVRDLQAARRVGRLCVQSCVPANRECIGRKTCLCDRECGYSCIDQLQYCVPPPTKSNGMMVQVYRTINGKIFNFDNLNLYIYNDSLQYKCDLGYKINPDLPHMCHAGGRWTNINSSCVRACRSADSADIHIFGLVCGKSCVTNDECSANEDCLCDGACGRTCVDPNFDCGTAPPTEKSTIKYSGKGFYRLAHYVCEKGLYLARGSPTRKCTGGGTYDGWLPTCEKIECRDPFPTFRGTHGSRVRTYQQRYQIGRNVKFSCPPSYRLLGSKNRTCLANGQWSGKNAVCDRLADSSNRCPHPGIPIAGSMRQRSDFRVGREVEFACDAGLFMVGERRQTCLSSLRWSGDGAPKCIDPRLPFEHKRIISDSRQFGYFLVEPVTNGNLRARYHAEVHSDFYFVIDIALSDEGDLLDKTLRVVKDSVVRLFNSNHTTRKVKVIIYATEVEEWKRKAGHHLSRSQSQVLELLDEIQADKENIRERLGNGRNFNKMVKMINSSLSSETHEDRRTHIFLTINGIEKETNPFVSPDDFAERVQALKVTFSATEFYTFQSCINCLAVLKVNQLFLDTFISSTNHLYLVKDSGTDSLRTNPNLHEDVPLCGQVIGVSQQNHGVTGNPTSPIRVIGGDVATEGSWPWHAVISHVFHSLKDFRARVSQPSALVAGGSLINNKWILTASHIFLEATRSGDWHRNYFVMLGMHKLQMRDRDFALKVKIFLPEKIIYHANYNFEQNRSAENNDDYDVALIKLGLEYRLSKGQIVNAFNRNGVTFTDTIMPVCLPCLKGSCNNVRLLKRGFGESQAARGNLVIPDIAIPKEDEAYSAVVTGFGIFSEQFSTNRRRKIPSQTLQQGPVEVKHKNECSDAILHMTNKPHHFTPRMICAIGRTADGVIDACEGDSGGPLVTEMIDVAARQTFWTQVGIVSWGFGCGQHYISNKNGLKKYFPGYYTSVVSLLPWIKSHINADQVQPESSRTVIARCSIPQQPINGKITGKRNVGAIITYSCQQGYRLRGNLSRVCQADGTWSGSTPTCEVQSESSRIVIARCSIPQQPINGKITGKRNVGAIITYSCQQGYRLRGNLSRVCQANGTWSGSIPTCEAFCSLNNVQSDLIVEPKKIVFYVGEVVKFSCKELARRPSGSSSATCQQNGQWTNPPPKCRVVSCSSPNEISSGLYLPILSNYAHNAQVTYYCRPDYKLVGKNTALCNDSGQWDSEPSCILNSCSINDDLSNLDLRPVKLYYNYGEQVTFTCKDQSLHLFGESIATCQDGGNWSSPFPTCKTISCSPPRNLPSGNFKPVQRKYLYNATITYSCLPGYKLVGKEVAKCNKSGKWNQKPSCHPHTCSVSNLPNSLNVEPRKNVYNFGDQVRFVCKTKALQISGSPTSVCQKRGKWTRSIPTCEKTCSMSNLPNNLNVEPRKNVYNFGDQVSFVCKTKALQISGSPTSVCQKSGKWSNSFPTCESITCLPPPDPVWGTFFTPELSSYPYGTIIIYSCRPGYILIGGSTAKCYKKGKWDATPTCVLNSCSIANISPSLSIEPIKTFYDFGDKVTFSCKQSSFRLTGASTSTCVRGGDWVNDIPSCQKACTLGDLPAFLSAEPARTFYDVNDQLTFTCTDRRFRLSGASTSRCLNNGRWSGSYPKCKFITCPPPPKPNKSSYTPVFASYFIDETVNFVCDPGYKLIGNSKVTCSENGIWSSSPSCVRSVCPAIESPPDQEVLPSNDFYNVGEKVTVSCTSPLQRPIGPTTLTCQSNLKWSTSLPTCNYFCSLTNTSPMLDYRPLQIYYNYGNQVTFTCKDQNFLLHGKSTATCRRNGKWSNAVPTCESICEQQPWSSWSQCSTSCGQGTVKRERLNSCENSQIEQESRICFFSSDVLSPWSSWSSCNDCMTERSSKDSCTNEVIRERQYCISVGDLPFLIRATGQLTPWTPCRALCGWGVRTRNVFAVCNGRLDTLQEQEICDGAVAPLGHWSSCSSPCPTGIRTRRMRSLCTGETMNEEEICNAQICSAFQSSEFRTSSGFSR